MSRIGLSPITIPSEVSVQLDGNSLQVKGPKGQLELKAHQLITLSHQDNKLTLTRKNNSKFAKSLHGTTRSLVANMIVGVTRGFEKTLDLVGTGYRVAKQGSKISLSLGFSHPIEVESPPGLDIKIEGNNKIIISGLDKQSVGQLAAHIRAFRPPEPYKGKGIRYSDEVVRRKAGKTAKTAA